MTRYVSNVAIFQHQYDQYIRITDNCGKNEFFLLQTESKRLPGFRPRADLTVKRVKSMIHEYYQSGITLEEIAQKLDVTPEYLSSLFHRSVGQTFTNYMKDYRIGKAKELLIGTPMKLFEIAQAVGYTDGKYFSKVFKEREGCLPAQYRRMHK